MRNLPRQPDAEASEGQPERADFGCKQNVYTCTVLVVLLATASRPVTNEAARSRCCSPE